MGTFLVRRLAQTNRGRQPIGLTKSVAWRRSATDERKESVRPTWWGFCNRGGD